MSKNKKYSYLGHPIYVRESVDVYLNLYKNLKRLSQEGVNNLKKYVFMNGNNHFEDMITLLLTPIKEGETLTIESLEMLGLDYSEDDFIDAYRGCFSILMNSIVNYEEQYSDILQRIAGMDAYRCFKQETRGRFIGGGFGIDGMLKGAITATTANAIVGAGYTAVNIICGVATRIKVNNKLIDLSESYRKTIIDCKIIETTLKNIEYAFLDICSNIKEYQYILEYDECYNLYDCSRYELGWDNDDQKIRDCLILLGNAPYCPALYKILLRDFGDEQEELTPLANKYRIKLSKIKQQLGIK